MSVQKERPLALYIKPANGLGPHVDGEAKEGGNSIAPLILEGILATRSDRAAMKSVPSLRQCGQEEPRL